MWKFSKLIEFIKGLHMKKAQMLFARTLGAHAHTIIVTSKAQQAPHRLCPCLCTTSLIMVFLSTIVK